MENYIDILVLLIPSIIDIQLMVFSYQEVVLEKIQYVVIFNGTHNLLLK